MKVVRKKLQNLSLKEVEEIEFFLDTHFCTIFHEPAFNRVVEEIFTTNFSYNLGYNKDGKLVSLCPLHTIKDGILACCYSNPAIFEMPYGGWIYDTNETNITELMDRMNLSSHEGLTYWSTPQIDRDDYLIIKKKEKFKTAIIDLNMSEDEIWQTIINSKRRNMIRKAEKYGISVATLDVEKFDKYYHLMLETYQSAGMAIKPKAYYIRLFNLYSQDNKICVMVAKKDKEFFSGVVLLRNKFFCHYWLGASKSGVENLGQGELLQWQAIKWAKKSGSRYYDLCVVEPERLPNIARFKLGFSQQIVPFYCISKKNFSYRIFSRFQRCFLED